MRWSRWRRQKAGPLFFAAAFALAAACAPARAPEVTPQAGRDAIYEVFTRDFSPAGNFRGLTDGLDRIQTTGANVIWLMPIHPIGKLNRKDPLGSSYSVTDYRAINPDYGTEADFRTLIRAAHARGMKVIIDWVPNHTAWDHIWVREHPARYTRDDKGQMTVPRDNQGKPTDWTDVADLNYNDPGLRRAMIADMRYWLETYDIDGFRADVASWVPDDFWRDALAQLRTVKPILLLAEAGEARMHLLGFDLSYGWDSYGKLKAVWKGEPAASFVEHAVADVRSLPSGMRLRFTTNHDETAWDQPPVTLFGSKAGARAAFVAMTLLPGVPLIYNGQEVESPQKLGLFVKEPIAWDQPDAHAAIAFYKRVITLARTHQAFTRGDLQPLQTNAGNDVIAYQRGNVLVLVNTRPRAVSVAVAGRTVSGTRDLLSGASQANATIELGPYGTAVLAPRP
jgi:glycosidase